MLHYDARMSSPMQTCSTRNQIVPPAHLSITNLKMTRLVSLALFGVALLAAVNSYGQAQSHRFETNVRAYEAADKTNPPPRNAILLAGDSQFFRWKTVHEDLPDYTIINRGIDSFQMSDLLFFEDRLVLPYQPRMIVLHIGGNDVHAIGRASCRERG